MSASGIRFRRRCKRTPGTRPARRGAARRSENGARRSGSGFRVPGVRRSTFDVRRSALNSGRPAPEFRKPFAPGERSTRRLRRAECRAQPPSRRPPPHAAARDGIDRRETPNDKRHMAAKDKRRFARHPPPRSTQTLPFPHRPARAYHSIQTPARPVMGHRFAARILHRLNSVLPRCPSGVSHHRRRRAHAACPPSTWSIS